MFGLGKKKKEKGEGAKNAAPFYGDALEICFHPIYTQTPAIFLMTKGEETRIQFLAFLLTGMDVYFQRDEDPEAVRNRWENVRLFAAYLRDREGILADPGRAADLTGRVDALFQKVMQTGEDLSLDDKFNMVLYNAKAFLGMEPRSRKNGRLDRLRAAWKECEADARRMMADEEGFFAQLSQESD